MADNERSLKKCKCDEIVKGENLRVESESFAMTLIKESAKQAKRWFIISIVILTMWILTIGGFVYYISQYDFSSASYSQDGQGTNQISGGDINGANTYNKTQS